MLFNVLSVVLVWSISDIALLVFLKKYTPNDPENQAEAASGSILIVLIFAWLMSWQNWWR